MNYSIIFIWGLIFLGCGIPDRAAPAIGYVEIKEMQLNVRSGEGDSGNNFRDAWIFLEGQSHGVFELPRVIPILEDANGYFPAITIQAGIRENGINSSPRVFPFVDNFEMVTGIIREDTIEVVPVFQYLEQIKFRLIADFELDNLFGFDEDGNEETFMVRTNERAASGFYSGKFSVPSGSVMEQASTLIYRELPKNGSPIYLEIAYSGDADLEIGLIGIDGQSIFKEYFVALRAENEWKKTYINFTEFIVSSDLDGYQIVMGVNNTSGSEAVNVYIDNLKFLHF